ncbi:MAG: ABC transporter permease [Armatimonadaceae bacterium]
MNEPLSRSPWARLLALIVKELRQIRRNRPLLISLIIPPTVQIIIFGFALNPSVNHLRLGVVDSSRTVESRNLIAAFTANDTFTVAANYLQGTEMEAALNRGDLDAALVIPPDFARKRQQGSPASVQILINAINAINANTANIAQGYAGRIVAAYNNDATVSRRTTSPVQATVSLLYNPGLENSWFIITGTFGILLILNGSLVAASSTIREKENGTLEQLLMTPAGTTEIIIAKMTPLFFLLMMDIFIVLGVGWLVFGVPINGNLGLLLLAGALCVLTGIGIGTTIATFTRTGLQAQMLTFFVNPPLALLSGATTPLEGMPEWLQPLTLFNPVRHFAYIARSIMIKGSGLEAVGSSMLALALFALVLLFISVRRFRSQLA